MLTHPFDPARPDLCVIGAGTAGHAVALGAAALGLRCTVVDPRPVLGAGQLADLLELVATEAAARLEPDVIGDWNALARRAGTALARAAPDHGAARLRTLGVAVVTAAPRFAGPRTLLAGGMVIRARRFVLATGTDALVGGSAMPGLMPDDVATPAQLLRGDAPARVAVLAGQPGALAWAQVLARHGVRVTLALGPGAVGGVHAELADFALAGLRRDGVEIRAAFEGADARGSGLTLVFACGRPATAGLDLVRAGVASDAQGAPTVDGRLRTTNPRVLALGAVLGRPGSIPAEVGAVLRAVAAGLPFARPLPPAPVVLRTVPPVAQVGTLDGARLWRAPAASGSPAGPALAMVATDARGRVVGAGIAGTGAAEAVGAAGLAVARRWPASELVSLPCGGLAGDALRRAALAATAERLRAPTVKRLIGLVQKLP